MPISTGRVERFSLSALEFDVLVEHLGLEAMPLVLKVPSPGRTDVERADLVDSAWRSLAARDLGSATGLDTAVEDALRLLARPDREVDGRLWLGRGVRVLAAADDAADRAVLVVKEADRLEFRSAAASGLAREAVSVLPPAVAGPGRSVSLRSADLDAAAAEAGDGVERLPAALRRRGVRAEDAENLTGMVGEVTAQGQFGVAARDRLGRRHRGAHTIGTFDNDYGRYLQLRRASPSGELWSTVTPADSRQLAAHLDELLATLAG
ncbi:ESX secretion-associated protein EspG [Saccharopolyspora sp. CA-218241]|uniref:ESX secretion-associated protein EspG n=1 Tax=Saccharopolyspora sp. CA-218241 TaxID=3240027 RepID=UPI003D954FB5